jgi:hypothetical protein
MDPRSRRRMKKGTKDTKLQSLPRKPAGTCMDQSELAGQYHELTTLLLRMCSLLLVPCPALAAKPEASVTG